MEHPHDPVLGQRRTERVIRSDLEQVRSEFLTRSIDADQYSRRVTVLRTELHQLLDPAVEDTTAGEYWRETDRRAA